MLCHALSNHPSPILPLVRRVARDPAWTVSPVNVYTACGSVTETHPVKTQHEVSLKAAGWGKMKAVNTSVHVPMIERDACLISILGKRNWKRTFAMCWIRNQRDVSLFLHAQANARKEKVFASKWIYSFRNWQKDSHLFNL